MANKLHRFSGLALTCFSLQRTHISSPLNARAFVTHVNNHNENKQSHKLQMHVPPDSFKEGLSDDDFSSYNQAIRSQLQLRNTDKALELMEKARWRTRSLNFNMLIYVLCEDRKVEEAAKLFQKMLVINVTPTPSAVFVLVAAHCRIGEIKKAKGILKQIKNLGMFPNRPIFNVLLGALCRKRRTEEANEVLKEMEGAGIAPDLMTYEYMFRGHMKCGNLDAVVALFKEVSTKEVMLSAATLNSLLQCLLMMGKTIEIAPVLERLCSNGVTSTIEIYSALVDVCPQKGLSWKEQMEKHGFKPDSVTYNSLIRRLSQLQNVARVEELVRLVSDRGLAPNLETYNILIDAYGLDGQFDKCFQLLEEMKQKGLEPNEIIYASLLSCLCQKGKSTEALRLLDKMSKAGISPSSELYNSVICLPYKGPQVLIGAEVKAGEPAKVEIEDGRILHLSQDGAEAGDESDIDDGSSGEEDESDYYDGSSGEEDGSDYDDGSSDEEDESDYDDGIRDRNAM